MHMIVYTSCANNPHSIDIKNIVSGAMVRNADKDITGALFFDNGTFLQVLEGDKCDLMTLMEEIKRDKRHSNIKILIDQTIPERTLLGWSMQHLNLQDLQAFHELNIELFSAAINNLIQPRADQFIHSLKTIFASPDVNRMLVETI